MFAFQDQYQSRIALNEQSNKSTNKKSQKIKHKLQQFLNKIDQQNNSQDQGIQDYIIGGYHPIHIGQVLINRYVVIQKLGWGHFSTVWLCKDFKYKTYVAIKIQKSSPHYMQSAYDQIEILQKVQKHYNDPNWQGINRDDTHVVGLLNAFVHKTYYGDHFCMVFQVLRCNLLDIIKRYNYQGLPLPICQQISKQVLIGLDYLHRICGVIHTDLKPQNVMVCLSQQEVKDIVENGQLSNNQLFAQRAASMRHFLNFQLPQKSKQNLQKIQILEQRLKEQTLTKNQKKNLKKRLKKQKTKQNNEKPTQNKKYKFQNFQDLFDLKKGKIKLNRGQKLTLPFKVKIADLGNACWKHHQFSTQIQTRQYRSPQVILGQNFNQTADIWSFGCMMYQMLTGDLLFQPRKTQNWGKNADHLAQIQQLLGKFSKNFIIRTQKGRKYFNKDGSMKKFQHLNHFPLDLILQLKNKIDPIQSKQFSSFIMKTLVPQPQKRISARQALKQKWLGLSLPETHQINQKYYQQLKLQFQTNQSQFKIDDQNQLIFYASEEDNFYINDDQTYDSQRMIDIRLVDRSFTDLGYIGYSDGIDLQKLDSQKNWQFS